MIDFLQTQLFSVGFSNAVIATVFALIVFVLTCKSKLPLWTHALWVLVLIKLVTPPLFWLPAILPGAADATQPAAVVADVFAGEAAEFGMTTVEASTLSQRPLPTANSKSHWAMTIPWLNLLVFGWLLGSLIVAIGSGVKWFRFRRWLRQGTVATTEIQDQLAKVASQIGLRKVPATRIVTGAIAPSVYSIGGRATLLLPAGLLDQLNAQEMETVFAHELAHLRRRDHWVRLLELTASVLFWWHPIVPIARKKIHQAADEACDLTVQTLMPDAMRSYASAMLKTVDFLSTGESDSQSPGATPLLTGMGDVQSLARRMRQISRSPGPSGRSWLRRIVIGAVAVMTLPLGILALAPVADGQQPPAQKPPAQQQPKAAEKIEDGKTPKPIDVKQDAATRQATQEALRKKLKMLVSIAAKNEPLDEVVKKLSDQWGVPMVVDARALEEIGLTTDVPVTLNLKNVSLRSTLRLMCRALDLTHTIKDEVVQITTIEAAERNLAVRAYSLPTVLAPQAEKVIAALTRTVVPDTWEDLGGPSSVYAIENVLVVSTTEDIHAQVEDFIARVDAAHEKRKKMEAAK